MADETHVDLSKAETDVRNKAYPEEILCDKGKE